MLTIVLAFQIVILLALIYLLLRKPANTTISEDPRLAQLLTSDLPATLARAEARGEALDTHLRAELAQLRDEAATEAARGRDAANAANAALRTEVLGNINTLGETQRSSMDAQLSTLTQRFTTFTTDSSRHAADARDALHRRLTELGVAQTEHQDKLRATVEQRLDALNANNEKKLEEMRSTVDEKLHATLQTRLTESFGAVTDQLSKVHAGLGEMNTLSTGVNDLNRIFSNVKSRGGFAEVQLGKLLEQVLAPGQYVENAHVRPGTQEVVEFAVRFPGTGGDVLLPIDAKFPREDWERLETAYESGVPASVEQARKAFDAAIRTEGKRICAKYINEPVTTPYAIMFLPTEGLYAEVLRRDGLQADLHQNCRVMVAGPSNLYALLTSFQLGFRMLNLQKKGNEVWNVLAKTQTEFKTFETLMGSMENQVGT
ncbi:MAG: DNA recombination protein RmuC, partial [Acidobacteriaceae bacterium]